MSKKLEGESVTRSSMVLDNVVTCKHVTRHASGQEYICTWKFDWTDVSLEELQLEANKDAVISSRTTWKKLPIADAEKLVERTINMREYLDRTRRHARSDTDKAGSLMDKMAPDELAALIAKYSHSENIT
jgi:hypothetical protein